MPDTSTKRVFAAGDPSVLGDVRGFVLEIAGGLEPELVQDLQLAVTEACANAIRHSGSAEVRVSVRVLGACVEATIEDDGIYLDHLPPADGDEYGHRGMFLMVAMVDELGVKRGTAEQPGTTIRLVKCFA